MTTTSPQCKMITEDVPDRIINSDSVVVSGMSGLYPDCKSVKDLADILYKKKNPITSENQRWTCFHPEVVQSTGKLSDLNRFDAQFFKVHFHLGNCMDSMGRKILEQTYQAIYDAGISPGHLAGKNIGVYIGTCFSESEKTLFYVANSNNGFGIPGCCKSMFANRISYWLNVKGPSMAVDEACCSSISALQQAYNAINRGECEAAIVGGTNLCLHPHSIIHHGRLLIGMEAKTKSFDRDANGCAKSEAINILFIQRAKDALRMYAEIVHVKTEFTTLENGLTGPKFGFYRNPKDMTKFLQNFYDEAKVLPNEIEYVEAFGSAVPDADKSELDSIDEVFNKNREKSLLIGSVMSNIGYSEAATGISAITKVLLGYETGILAGNLHYTTPRDDISGIRDGRIQVLSENTSFNRKYTAVNGLSVTGVNSHILLNGCYKPKDINRYKSNIPYLVTISGRQDSAVKAIFNNLKQRPIDPEELALLHNIHQIHITGHMGRGYAILDTNEDQKTVCLKETAGYFNDAKRPLWFVYSGMGSQWPTMGSQLMRIPIFAASIERCQKILEPKKIDIVDILTSSNEAIFHNILHSFVGIAAVQIGLTDVLFALGIKPDKIIGHSVGELGCAYADGCLTAEEMILSAYSRGLVSLQTPFIRGSMAAVGMGYKEISALCPPSIEVACRNSSKSSTISGPAKDMQEFVTKLVAKGIFAKEVPCSNIAYHSRYIAEAGPSLLKYLTKVIKTPKKRSERWMSTSVPQHRWNEPAAMYSSAEYHTNNLLNPVLFEETSNLIPSNAILVEIAPHGLLQAILKRSLQPSCRNIALTQRGHPDNAVLLLEAVGNLYMEGFNPKVQELFPKVEFPVSTGTPMLSHLVEWIHTESWPLPLYMAAHRKTAASCKFVISIHDEDSKYLRGNQITDKTFYPFAAALVAVWDTLAMSNQLPRKQISVVFQDVKLYCQPVLHDQRQLKLHVVIHRGSGKFEVNDEYTKVVSGFVRTWKVVDKHSNNSSANEEGRCISSDDIYNLLRIREYSYNGDFRSILKGNSNFTSFSMLWNDNWVTLIDGLLQANALRQPHNGVSQPMGISKLSIDVIEHMKHIEMCDAKKVIQANVYEIYNTTKCGGLLLQGVQFHQLPLHTDKYISLKFLKSHSHYLTKPENEPESDADLSVLQNSNCKLKTSMVKNVNSLQRVRYSKDINSGLEVKVHYAGITRMDVSKATGATDMTIGTNYDNSHFGFDFSGVTKGGDRVMGIVVNGSCKSTINARTEFLWPIPDHWSFEDAATVPLAYMTALYCLNYCSGYISRAKEGNRNLQSVSILIHGGAGALGQALISIGLAMRFEIFTTVSDSSKKHFLMKLFPELKGEHIGCSRDASFRDMVLCETKGAGCMILINCLKGELRNVSLKCAPLALDVSMYNPHDDCLFGMAYLHSEHSYASINIMRLLTMGNQPEIELLQKALSEGISRGYIRPLSRTIFTPQEVSRALNLLARRRHRGRILIKLDGNSPLLESRIQCNADSCYVLFCGQDLLGFQLADRLIRRGAKKIFLHYKSFPEYLSFQLKIWKSWGVEVEISCNRIDKLHEVQNTLSRAADMGNVDGIIIDALHSYDADENRVILQNIDLASKKMFPALRYFAIITDNYKTKEKYLCTNRHKYGPSSTIIDVNLLEKDQNTSYSTRNYLCVQAVEAALCCDKTTIIVEPKTVPSKSLLQKLCDVAGLKIPEMCRNTTTLRDLGMMNEIVPIVANYLRDHCNIILIEDDVASLTLERIKEIENALTAPGYTSKKGLEAFYSFVDPDELLATTEIVFMPTLTSNTTMRDDEFDKRETSLCIIPGLEGHHARFRVLCKRLKVPAFVLQPGLDNLNETIQQTAQRYADFLLQKSAIKDRFIILGYEIGIFVALELAAILEKTGLTGTVFLLGGSPEDISSEIENHLQGIKTMEELQDAVAVHMLRLMVGDNTNTVEIDDLLSRCSSWQERVELVVRKLLGGVSHSAQYARAQIEAAFARLVEARRYSGPAAALRSRVVLLRCPLSARSDHTHTHDILAPLSHAAMDLRCAAIINKYLDEDIIEKFNRKNLCETYLLNSETYMSFNETSTTK